MNEDELEAFDALPEPGVSPEGFREWARAAWDADITDEAADKAYVRFRELITLAANHFARGRSA